MCWKDSPVVVVRPTYISAMFHDISSHIVNDDYWSIKAVKIIMAIET